MTIDVTGRGAKQHNQEPSAHFQKSSIKNEFEPDSLCLKSFFTQFKTHLIYLVTIYLHSSHKTDLSYSF